MRITQSDAYKMMNDDVVILDVRETYEYKAGHIKGSINVPVGHVPMKIKKLVTDKDKTILVYCLSGARSAVATKLAGTLGYQNVKDFGGLATWEYEIVKEG